MVAPSICNLVPVVYTTEFAVSIIIVEGAKKRSPMKYHCPVDFSKKKGQLSLVFWRAVYTLIAHPSICPLAAGADLVQVLQYLYPVPGTGVLHVVQDQEKYKEYSLQCIQYCESWIFCWEGVHEERGGVT